MHLLRAIPKARVSKMLNKVMFFWLKSDDLMSLKYFVGISPRLFLSHK